MQDHRSLMNLRSFTTTTWLWAYQIRDGPDGEVNIFFLPHFLKNVSPPQNRIISAALLDSSSTIPYVYIYVPILWSPFLNIRLDILLAVVCAWVHVCIMTTWLWSYVHVNTMMFCKCTLAKLYIAESWTLQCHVAERTCAVYTVDGCRNVYLS